jgi:hypothetical protein
MPQRKASTVLKKSLPFFYPITNRRISVHMHVYQRNFSTRTLLQHKLHQLSAKKKKRNTHIPAAIMQVLRISTREKPDETKPFPNHIARIRSSVAETTTLPGNRGRIGTQRPHLAAGEEELLAAVVPPGDDLPAVQADLQPPHQPKGPASE